MEVWIPIYVLLLLYGVVKTKTKRKYFPDVIESCESKNVAGITRRGYAKIRWRMCIDMWLSKELIWSKASFVGCRRLVWLMEVPNFMLRGGWGVLFVLNGRISQLYGILQNYRLQKFIIWNFHTFRVFIFRECGLYSVMYPKMLNFFVNFL